MRISVAQFNFVVGDLVGNAQRIVQAATDAHAAGAQLLLTPELALSGYAAEDLYLREQFLQAVDDALKTIAARTAHLEGLHIVVGHAAARREQTVRTEAISTPPCLNMATVLHAGEVVASYAKRELPNYQVFDERRYFEPGQDVCVFDVAGTKVGLLICADAWFEQPALDAQAAGAQVLVVINASPFHMGKGAQREAAMAQLVQRVPLPLVYAHMVGGQDELVFDGRSFMLDARAQVVARAPSFVETLITWTLAGANDVAVEQGELSDLWQALVMGVRDYVGKNKFPGVVLGLSGGVDSALVLAIAVDALGAQRVRAVMMPSPYTADISLLDAAEMAKRMNVRYTELDITPHFEVFKQSLAREFDGIPEDTTEENLQARIRGTLLMALSNKWGSMVLTTGNKSEMATGYCTLYGDMAGGFAVIKDVLKTRVFALCNWRNANNPFATCDDPIPERIITRPPSAELRADQTDQDSLPEYAVLDAIIAAYMEQDVAPADIVASGYAEADVAKVVRLIRINEYKRRQSPPGVRVSHRAFGKDWRYPITNRFFAAG
ncbi:NAD+ synthase [Comamonadaceae bacterium M7527]|nr:NAD+ synthase [Comamonadaceae bacterium M7527]